MTQQKVLGSLLLLPLGLSSLGNLPASAATLFTGVAAGDPTPNSVILWTRATDSVLAPVSGTPGVNVTAQIASDAGFTTILRTVSGVTNPSRDYTLKLDVGGLSSGTQYYYRFQSADSILSPVGDFKTAPALTANVPVTFGFSADADGQWRPYPLTKNFASTNLDFFVFLGDTIYETASTGSPAAADPFANPTQATADYRRKYLEQIIPVSGGSYPGLEVMFRSQGNYTVLDNHELGNKQFINGGAPAGTPSGAGVLATNTTGTPYGVNDVNTTGAFINKTPGFQAVMQAYNDYQPIRERTISAPGDLRTDGTQQLYFAQQWGADTLYINLDDRSYRDIRLKLADNSTDDLNIVRASNPDRTMLGKTQLEWLKQTLQQAQSNGVEWKFISISSPIDEAMDKGAGLNGKHWAGGYRAERNELLKFIADNKINNVVFLSADDHQYRVAQLDYFVDPADPSKGRIRVPNTFTIVGGPLGAGGPDAITDHSPSNIQTITNTLVAAQRAAGNTTLGLQGYMGLQNVFRDGYANADQERGGFAFYSPDTFNYVTLGVSADGQQLTVNAYGINSYARNTFPEPSAANDVRLISSFQVQAVPEPTTIGGLALAMSFLVAQRRRKTAKSV